MNNFQPSVNDKDFKEFIPKTSGVANAFSLGGMMPSSAASLNNNLNTFQEYEKAEKPEESTKTQTVADAIANSTKSNDSSADQTKDKNAASDFRLKLSERFQSEHGDLLDIIQDLNAYRFKYKPGAEKIDPDATPDKERVGVMAQELQNNPVTSAAVEEDPLSGFLTVNTKELTLTTFALVTEMAKRIKAIEEKLGGSNGRSTE